VGGGSREHGTSRGFQQPAARPVNSQPGVGHGPGQSSSSQQVVAVSSLRQEMSDMMRSMFQEFAAANNGTPGRMDHNRRHSGRRSRERTSRTCSRGRSRSRDHSRSRAHSQSRERSRSRDQKDRDRVKRGLERSKALAKETDEVKQWQNDTSRSQAILREGFRHPWGDCTKDAKALKDKVMLVVDDKLMDITEEGCVQLMRLQKIDVTAVQPRREGARFIDNTMAGLVGSFRLWFSAFQSIMFHDIKEDTEMRVIKDMSRTVEDMNAFALRFQQCDSNTADYAYKELQKALQEDLLEFCKQLARRSDRAALIGDRPKKSERSGRYIHIPSPPTFRPHEVNTTIAHGSLVREMIKKLPHFQQFAKSNKDDSGTIKVTNQSPNTSSTRSSEPCFRWRETGSCHRSDTCFFAHKGEVIVVDDPTPVRAPAQAAKKDK
jgi:hypothetical protein